MKKPSFAKSKAMSRYSLHPAYAMERAYRTNMLERTGKTYEQWREILRLLDEHRSTEQAYESALQYATRAKSCLSAFPPSQEREALLALTDYVVSRDR